MLLSITKRKIDTILIAQQIVSNWKQKNRGKTNIANKMKNDDMSNNEQDIKQKAEKKRNKYAITMDVKR